MYVVTGVTGNTGAVVASTLLDAGKEVRVVVRDLSSEKAQSFARRGAEVVALDLTDVDALAGALSGAEGVYLLSPPDVTSDDFIGTKRALVAGYAEAIRRSGVPHVVLLSSIGAQHADGTGPIRTVHHAEKVLSGLTALTVVRAAYFAENWRAVLAVAESQGVLPSFIPRSLAVPTVATKDIGEVAAAALLAGSRGPRRILELSGPEDPTPEDVAAVVSRIVGKDVQVAEAPLDAVVPAFQGFGFSADVAGLFREMYQGIASGKVAWEGAGAEAIRGKTTLGEALEALLPVSEPERKAA